MSTPTRPELSKKNPYYIPRHRYYELMHFCRQFQEWRKQLKSLESDISGSSVISVTKDQLEHKSPVEEIVIQRERYSQKIDTVVTAGKRTDPVLGYYIYLAVINGWSYDTLAMKLRVPMSKDTYYKLYRRFFWELDKLRN